LVLRLGDRDLDGDLRLCVIRRRRFIPGNGRCCSNDLNTIGSLFEFDDVFDRFIRGTGDDMDDREVVLLFDLFEIIIFYA
jgi:hypothetical protein